MNSSGKISIVSAALNDYPTIQNMARFYVYDLSRECGFISKEWAIPKNGLYESFDFKNYFEDPTRKAFIIKVNNELAGFVLLDQIGTSLDINWNMGEFFILGKFQGTGVGRQVAHQIWNMYPGSWEISVIPENKQALTFWRKAISSFTDGEYSEEIKVVDYDPDQPNRYIFNFNTNNTIENIAIDIKIRSATQSDIFTMVALSYEKRRAYEKAQPQFWRYASCAEKVQTKWFNELLAQDDHILLVAELKDKVVGFIIGKIVKSPEVYDPGGLTVMIDDFCVISPSKWELVGSRLFDEIKHKAKTKGALQVLSVCGAHDEPKSRLLKNLGLTIASCWYVGGIV